MAQATGKHRNLWVVVMLLGIMAGMTGLVVASVPLYRLFCQVTGYGGTTQRADAAPGAIGERRMTVRFNADVNESLPWAFYPEQRAVAVPIGESILVSYRAENRSRERLTGTATFNVTPAKAGQYFVKTQCFCFTEQTLPPGEGVDMPVSFFVDPAILDDRNLDDVDTITLSYTFFHAADDQGGGDAPRQASEGVDAGSAGQATGGSVN